jgi:hypothetical protein
MAISPTADGPYVLCAECYAYKQLYFANFIVLMIYILHLGVNTPASHTDDLKFEPPHGGRLFSSSYFSTPFAL